MYIKRVKDFDDLHWMSCILNSEIETKELKTIKIILSSETKEIIEAYFKTLKDIGVINGIGPNWIGKYCRKIMTFIFPFIKYGWHDIQYFIGGTKEDKKDSDYGLLKYSILSILDRYKTIDGLDTYVLIKNILVVLYTPIAAIECFIALILWILLINFGTRAFYYTK